MTRLLALPQNDTHVETLRCLLPELAKRNVQTSILNLDPVFHQRLHFGALADARVAEFSIRTSKPFYRLHPFVQLWTAVRGTPQLIHHAHSADIVLAFNDGSLQRVALRAARQRGARTALLLDGMISRYERQRSTLRLAAAALSRRSSAIPLAPYLPSEIGLSAVDVLFVIGEHSASVLRERGAAAAEILASGLPRIPPPVSDQPPRRLRKLIYLTGAFAWHGRGDLSAGQLNDVSLIFREASAQGIEFSVRVHPRDDPTPFIDAGVPISAASEPMERAIRNADVVTSFVSTGLVEAIGLARIARTVCIHPDWGIAERSFAADPMFGPIRSAATLRADLANMRDGMFSPSFETQRAGYARYVAEGGANAVRLIVDRLLR